MPDGKHVERSAGCSGRAWRMLNRLRQESWAMENLDMLYLDDDKLAWAKSTGDHEMMVRLTFTVIATARSCKPAILLYSSNP